MRKSGGERASVWLTVRIGRCMGDFMVARLNCFSVLGEHDCDEGGAGRQVWFS